MIAPGLFLFPMDKLYQVMGYTGVCTIGRSAREGPAHTSSRDKDGRNSSRGETIVREREEGGRKTGSAHSFAPAEEIVEEEEEEKTRNTFACPRRKEKSKFEGEESTSKKDRMEQKERSSPLGWFKKKRRR